MEPSRVHLRFAAPFSESLKWLAMLIASVILIVPFAWALAAFSRWLCRNIRFEDGAEAEFQGTGAEIAVWSLLGIAILAGAIFLIARPGAGAATIVSIVIIAGAFITAVKWMIAKWFVYNLRLSTGPALTFVGSYPQLVAHLFAPPIFYRWFAENIKGESVAVEFEGAMRDIWSIPRLIENFVLIRGADTSTWQLSDPKQRKRSSLDLPPR